MSSNASPQIFDRASMSNPLAACLLPPLDGPQETDDCENEVAAANYDYAGLFAGAITRQRPRKKPVLVLAADELASAARELEVTAAQDFSEPGRAEARVTEFHHAETFEEEALPVASGKPAQLRALLSSMHEGDDGLVHEEPALAPASQIEAQPEPDFAPIVTYYDDELSDNYWADFAAEMGAIAPPKPEPVMNRIAATEEPVRHALRAKVQADEAPRQVSLLTRFTQWIARLFGS